MIRFIDCPPLPIPISISPLFVAKVWKVERDNTPREAKIPGIYLSRGVSKSPGLRLNDKTPVPAHLLAASIERMMSAALLWLYLAKRVVKGRMPLSP
jgi:hypothetical protein